jgi:transposase
MRSWSGFCSDVPVIDPTTGVAHPAQIFVAVLGASKQTIAHASFSPRLPN